jgi:hypothetical protein
MFFSFGVGRGKIPVAGFNFLPIGQELIELLLSRQGIILPTGQELQRPPKK